MLRMTGKPAAAPLLVLMLAAPVVAASDAYRIEQRLAPIHDAAQLDDHLRTLSPGSPLSALSEAARQRFIASLRFNEAGLVSFSYQDIQKELSPTEAYRLLALFGAQRTMGLMEGLRARTDEDVGILEKARRQGSRQR